MALETVNILVQDDAVVPGPLDGVVVRVYDETGTTFITDGTTGAVVDGQVQFVLDGDAPPTRYQLRFFIIGGSIVSPQYIDVYSPAAGSPTGTNDFVISATLRTLSQATNPYLCRASGVVRGPDGRLLRNVDLHFVPCFNPLVVAGDLVLGSRVDIRTDVDGYVSIDLYRNGMYQVLVESHENVMRDIIVPDRSSINIGHLLFPIVVSASFSPAGPWAMSVGDDLELTPTIVATNYQTLTGAALADVMYTSDNEAVAVIGSTTDPNTILLRAVGPGTANINVVRLDESIVYTPDPGIDGAPVQVTVT